MYRISILFQSKDIAAGPDTYQFLPVHRRTLEEGVLQHVPGITTQKFAIAIRPLAIAGSYPQNLPSLARPRDLGTFLLSLIPR